MTPQELKYSILSLAIQGKLTERFPEDGDARALLCDSVVGDNVDGQRVKVKTVTEITDDEKAFDIPDTWEWVKLGNVCVIARGGSPRPIKEYITTAENGINWIKIGDTEKNGKYISATAEKIKPSGVSKSRMVRAGDFLLTNSMSFGRPYILKVDGCIHDGWLVISQTKEVFDQDYLYWLLSSNYAYMQFCGKVSGAVVKNLNSDKVANSVFPLPPLAEQKRIVAKIEELLPLIDRYEQAWSKLEDFNKRFPVDMQKSILQMAIQGKLVPQVPEEGTGEELFQQIQAEKQRLIKAGTIKKEKPLPEITEDEVPFDIPDSWKWVYIGDLFQHNTGKALNSSDKSGSPMEYITTSNVYWNSFTLDKLKTMLFTEAEVDKCTVQKGDLLVLEGGDVGRAAIWNYDFPVRIQNHIHKLRPFGELCIEYFYHIFFLYKNAGMINGKGIGIKGLSSGALHNLLVPLPPLAEQKRIVAKLEEILPLCERLK